MESSLEFVEDDLPPTEHTELLALLQRVKRELSQLHGTFGAGKLLREGIRVALLGRPNVGKSSLFNRLVGHNRAIVTKIPGTTRDTLTESIGLNGVPVVLTDTADEIESIGVERTRREAADADLLIVVIDGSDDMLDEDRFVLSEIATTKHIIALNKSDLPTFSPARFGNGTNVQQNWSAVISVSAKSEEGLESLRSAILQPFANGHAQSEGLLITNARHHDLLGRCVSAIDSSANLFKQGASEEIVLVDLHNALRYLDEITGETTTEDILGQIFSTFCIGK